MGEHSAEVVAILDEGFAKLTRDEALTALKAQDIACAEVRTAEDVLQDEHSFINEFLFKTKVSDGKEIVMVSTPVKVDDDTHPPFICAPKLGADTEDILSKYGYSKDEISKMVEDGVTAVE